MHLWSKIGFAGGNERVKLQSKKNNISALIR